MGRRRLNLAVDVEGEGPVPAVAQEALNNTVKQAPADDGELRLRYCPDDIANAYLFRRR